MLLCLCSAGGAFLRQQLFLAAEAPAVAGKVAVFANDAMAWHHDRDWIRGAGPRHRSHRLRISKCPRDLCIRPRRASRNLLEFLPDAPLKSGRLQVEG